MKKKSKNVFVAPIVQSGKTPVCHTGDLGSKCTFHERNVMKVPVGAFYHFFDIISWRRVTIHLNIVS